MPTLLAEGFGNKQTVNTDRITSIKALNADTTLISYYEQKVDEARKVVYDNHHINKFAVPLDVNAVLNAYNAAKGTSLQVNLLYDNDFYDV